MKLPYFLFAALLGLTACGSDSADGNYNRAASDELIDEQVDAGTKASVDSVAKATTEGNILFPVPDTLTNLLQQHRPQAKLAKLPDQTLRNRTAQVGNPIYLKGNFDGNNSPDYAVQVLQNDSIQVLAFLDYNTKARQVKVASYPARQLQDQWYSVYQLQLAPKDSVVQDTRNNRKTTLPTDGISVLDENRTTLYVLKNGRFIPFDAQE
ncbi:hypothetical protein FVR03_21500 [Pontibacter qinzhouensis]|uniref:Uncharacterized protein n=1 Tax=Pontibacter qinzhouensis TaxID=2603253 RepID=A0A5C8IZX2_9BACT|nr:hypothetical protein [Pontibacter qinzhouensis]TXK26765.1 hypothetical protein FVR03_21500 [Pontibacter qinzhouensis]